MRNDKAIRILVRGYWGASGWKEPNFSESDKALLEESGYLKQSGKMTHDECLAWAIEIRDQITQEQVVNAFLYSLTRRHLEYRSALGSYAHLQHMPTHDFVRADGFNSDFCRICGYETPAGRTIDFGVLNFERHKWGGVRHDDLAYAAYDLECLLALDAVEPTDADLDVLVEILRLANARTDTGRSVGHLKKGIAKVLKSNDSERDQICQILAYVGILQPDDCPSFADGYVPWDSRGDGRPRSDQNFPLGWWRGHGCRMEAVRLWFPMIADRV